MKGLHVKTLDVKLLASAQPNGEACFLCFCIFHTGEDFTGMGVFKIAEGDLLWRKGLLVRDQYRQASNWRLIKRMALRLAGRIAKDVV
jgi:hypothetical protein